MQTEPSSSTAQLTSAVVLNWHDTEQTLDCVRSLLAEPLVDHVFAVDNDADGDLGRALSRLSTDKITLIESVENRGYSAGVNLGLRAALSNGYSNFLMLNNDALLHPDALTHLLRVLHSAEDIAIVAPKIVNPDGTTQSSGSRLNRVTFSIDSLAAPGQADYLTWACVLVPRSTLERVGLLDERYFMYWEDVDYGFRIQAHGGRQVVVPEAVVSHNVSSSHSSAGDKILGYSALGLSTFGQSHGAGIKAAAFIRLCLRAAKLVGQGKGPLARKVLGTWRLARTNSAPAYLLFTGSSSVSGEAS